MLSTIIIGTDPRTVNFLRQVCAEFTNICVYKTIPLAARTYEIASALNHYAPDIAFLVVSEGDAAEVEGALPALQELLVAHPNTALIPVTATPEGVWRHHRSLGLAIAPALVCPFSAEEFEKAILAAMDRKPLRGVARAHLVAFMPSKAGAGATTVAMNFAGALANQFGKKILLIEGDFHSGALPVLLNLKPGEYGVQGVGDPTLLTETSWPRGVSKTCGMDVLAATPPQVARGSLWDYHRLLGFARERYEVVVVDLRDTVDEVASAVIGNSDRLYLVTTPEPASLGLLGRRLWEMEHEAIRTDHVDYVLNRHAPDDGPVKDLSAAIRRRFSAVLPDDSRAVKDATRNCRLAAPKTPFGREVASLARTFLEAVSPAELPPSPPSLRKLVTNVLGL